MAILASTVTGPAGVLLAVIDAPLWLRLFTNDLVPGPDDTVEAFVEATFAGYAPARLTRDDWMVSLGATPSAATTPRTFRCTADGKAESVVGYYLTGRDGALRAPASRFAGGPLTIEFEQDRLRVTPTLEGVRLLPGAL
jgi:hypothetical protein